MLGVREPSIYGRDTLGDIEAACADRAEALGLAVDFRQTTLEGELIARIQEARSRHDGIILNAGAYSPTSIAILDALTTAELPLIEVHLPNIFRREAFRPHSYVRTAAKGRISGSGA